MSNLSTEEMYGKVCSAAIDCDPIPASRRAQDTLEPPWLVLRRLFRERNAARAELKAYRPLFGRLYWKRARAGEGA